MKKRHALVAIGLTLCLGLAACTDAPAEETMATTVQEQTTEATTAAHGQPTQPPQEISNNDLMLLSAAQPVAELKAGKRDHFDNGTYYYTDATEDDTIRTISSSYVSTIRDDESEEDYASRRAIGLSAAISPGTPYQLTVVAQEELSEALGYPVYLVNFFTGSDQNALCWTVYLTHTEHYSYQYAFVSQALLGLEMEDTFKDYFATLKLEQMDKNITSLDKQ